MNKITPVLLALAAALAPSTAAAQAAASLTRIGAAAAVRGSVKATAPGAVGRVVESGKPLYLNDHVTTDAAGRLQVMLLDETIFTIGPNGDMVLDEFVYDPATSAGKVSATISKGAFRFVTGKVARKDPGQVKIKLAVGTIGVRGSIGAGETGPQGSLVINGGAGKADDHEDNAGIYAESKGKVVNLLQPGVGTRISPDGAIAPASFLKGELDRIMGSLKSDTAKAGKGPGGDVAGNGTTSSQSGIGTAQGGAHAYDASGMASESNGANGAQTVAALYGGIPDGIASWDQVRTLTTGIGSYSGSGTYSCSGGVRCSSPSSGNFSFTSQINFATKDISSVSLSFSGSPLVGEPGGSLPSPIAYNTFNGQATGQLNLSGAGNFTGTTFAISNKANTIAKDFTVNLRYIATLSETVTGTATGSR